MIVLATPYGKVYDTGVHSQIGTTSTTRTTGKHVKCDQNEKRDDYKNYDQSEKYEKSDKYDKHEYESTARVTSSSSTSQSAAGCTGSSLLSARPVPSPPEKVETPRLGEPSATPRRGGQPDREGGSISLGGGNRWRRLGQLLRVLQRVRVVQ